MGCHIAPSHPKSKLEGRGGQGPSNTVLITIIGAYKSGPQHKFCSAAIVLLLITHGNQDFNNILIK